MARRDGRGPLGQGPLSGRGYGICEGANYIPRCGGGFGRGMRMEMGRRGGAPRAFGRGLGFYEDNRSSKELLSEEKEMIQERLDFINEELENL